MVKTREMVACFWNEGGFRAEPATKSGRERGCVPRQPTKAKEGAGRQGGERDKGIALNASTFGEN